MQAAGETEFLELLEQHRTILFKIANLYCRNRADFAWGPFAGVLALWVVALLYVRMSPTRFKRLLERMARNLP